MKTYYVSMMFAGNMNTFHGECKASKRSVAMSKMLRHFRQCGAKGEMIAVSAKSE